MFFFYRKRVEDLESEIESNAKQYKQQIASLEEQVHANYVKMRSASRECDEHKREKEVYRKRLLDIDVTKTKSSTPLASKAGSDRANSPTNSNKSCMYLIVCCSIKKRSSTSSSKLGKF